MKQAIPIIIAILGVCTVVGLYRYYYPDPPQQSYNSNSNSIQKKSSVQLDIPPLKDSIGDMRIGETGWTTPWTLCTDGEIVRLNEYAIVHETPGGTVQLYIEKMLEGYTVTNFDMSYHWTKGYCKATGYANVIAFIQTQ